MSKQTDKLRSDISILQVKKTENYSRMESLKMQRNAIATNPDHILEVANIDSEVAARTAAHKQYTSRLGNLRSQLTGREAWEQSKSGRKMASLQQQ